MGELEAPTSEQTDGRVPCRLCGEPVHPRAVLCRHCGADLEDHTSWQVWAVGFVLVLSLGVLLRALGFRVTIGHRSESPTERAEKAPEPSPSGVATPDAVVDEIPPPRTIQEVCRGVVRVETDLGVGSGFVIADDGLVLTCNHVVAGASRIHVTGSGGYSADAVKVATLEDGDVALLKVQSTGGLPTIRLVDATTIQPGDPVRAVGYPLGLHAVSVTKGVISAAPTYVAKRSGVYLQLDAPVNPGNSGGPLVDERGDAVGIVAAKIEGAEGMSFASPANYVRSLPIPESSKPEQGGFGKWTAPDDAARHARTFSFAEADSLRIEGAAPAQGGVVVFVTVRSAAGKAMAWPVRITVELAWGGDQTGSCAAAFEATPSSFGSEAAAEARAHGVKVGDEPILAINVPCRKVAQGALHGLRVQARSPGVKQAGTYVTP